MTRAREGAELVAAYDSGGPFSFRNRIINGDMRIDARNAGASVTPSASTYAIDRWQMVMSQSSKFSVVQSSVAPDGFTNSMLITSTSAYTVGTNEVFSVRQYIEGFNVGDLAYGTASAKTVTLSFWVRSSLTGTFGGALVWGGVSANERSYPFTYNISSANTWEYKTVVIPGDTGTAASGFHTGSLRGIALRLSLGANGTATGTAGSWDTQNVDSATGAVSVVGTNGATWYITGVQLEVGSVATPFERRPYGTELSLCQRYFAKTYDYDVVPGTVTLAGAMFTIVTSANISQTTWCLPVEMRDNPTVTVYNGDTGGTGTWRDGGATSRTVNAVGIGTRNVSFQATAAAANSSLRGHGIANAEL